MAQQGSFLRKGQSQALPPPLRKTLDGFCNSAGAAEVLGQMRDPDRIMKPSRMGAMKATRLSFANILGRHMIDQRWSIRRERFSCDVDGGGQGVYRIDAAGSPVTYIARPYSWDGVEKVGRRSDGAKRDMFGAIMLGHPDDSRIAEEFTMFDLRDPSATRTRSDVTGWTPANRSARYFDHTVESLVAGRQPDPAVLGAGTGYLLRNGGYLGSGRQGSLTVDGYPAGHPFRHPFFADLFGLYMVRLTSVDLVNAVAQMRNPRAARLDPAIARYIGVGNSSGQGMCVALQRWPEWVAAWMSTRELALAHALTRRPDARSTEALDAMLARAASYYGSVELQCEDYVVPPATLAKNLAAVRGLLGANARSQLRTWADLAAQVEVSYDAETAEQVNALLIDLYPEFADAVADYLPAGMFRDRDLRPEATVEETRRQLESSYGWALRYDMRPSKVRQHFWYHSADNGEQRRGERVIDPHEEFESFIDHISLIQRVSAVLASYPGETSLAELLVDDPELNYGLARLQYMAGLPYAEIRDSVIHKDFLPSYLIRFFLSVLGMECTTPLSIRYVRGVFFQGMPMPDEIARGADGDWKFPSPPKVAAREQAA